MLDCRLLSQLEIKSGIDAPTITDVPLYRAVLQAVEIPLKISQTAAIMEVIHAATGIVKSPVGITAMQVASRLWCLWGIVVPCAHVVIPGGCAIVCALGRGMWGRMLGERDAGKRAWLEEGVASNRHSQAAG
jgi:hypothetical protein